MLTLNIIPNNLKKELKLKVIYVKLKNLLGLILLMIIFFSGLFAASRFILELHYTETIERTNTAAQITANYSDSIKTINSEVDYIENMQSEAVPWSEFISYLDRYNQYVDIGQLNISKSSQTLTIRGYAASRDNLLSFKSQLEESSFLENINLPIENLLKKTDIDFEITANFKNYEFR